MESLESLRPVIEAGRPRRLSAGYPQEVRVRVAAYVAARRAEGRGIDALAEELGLSRHSILTWCKPTAVEVPARLVPVEVFADEGAALEDVVPVVDAAPPEAPMGLSTSATPPEVRMAPPSRAPFSGTLLSPRLSRGGPRPGRRRRAP